MPKTKISEFSATPGNNTDIDGINIAEGCAPSGINDAIRELMAQLKDFQAGTAGDSFNGPIGATTPAAGTFTNLSASGTFALTGDQVQISEGGTGQTTANAAFNALAPSQSTHAGKYLKTDGTNTSWDAIDINTADITGTLPIANGGTGLTALGTGVQTALGQNVTGSGGIVLASSPSLTTPNLGTPSAVTLTNATGLPLSTGVTGTLATTNGGTGLTSFTANGVVYASSSSALTTGSALTFDGTSLSVAIVKRDVDNSFVTLLGGTSSATSAAVYATGPSYAAASTIYIDSAETVFRSLNGVSSRMALTSTGLGIGTSSPAGKLHVAGQTRIQDSANAANYILIGSGANAPRGGNSVMAQTGSMVMGTEAASNLVFITNAAEAARFDSSGNLGLGVTPSAWSLSGLNALQIKNGSLYGYINEFGSQANAYYNAGWKYITSAAASQYVQSSGVHSWYTAASGTAGNAISFTQAMTLDASGNFLVGTTSGLGTSNRASFVNNQSTRSVIAIQNTSTSGYSSVELYDSSGSQQGAMGWGNASVAVTGAQSATYLYSTGAITFLAGGTTERARITSGGNLLVGKTTTGLANTGIELSNLGWGQFTASGDASLFTNRLGSDGDTVKFYRDTSFVGSISVTASATAYNTSSDYRLKDNPQSLTGSGAFIDALKPKTWNWKTDGSKGVGFIAHEVQEVSPGSVVGTKDAVDEEGKPIMQAMEYGSAEFIANIIAELQSLRARVAQLEAK